MASNADTPEWFERAFGGHLVRCTHNYIDPDLVPIDGVINVCDVVGAYSVAENGGNLKRLAQLYESVNACPEDAVVGRRKRLELIQVGDANTTQDFPWFALEGVDRKERLLRRYGIQDDKQEWLLMLDAFSGELITSSGLERLHGDPDGKRFPWSPRGIGAVLRDAVLVNAAGDRRDAADALGGKVKGLYFSANWCPPCRAFTPQLIETYSAINAQEQRLEVVMVSSDRSQESFDAYLCTMPWLAISYDQADLRRELASLFGVGGIPTLVLLDADDRVITLEGRAEVNEDPSGLNFPWTPKLVNILTERFAAKLSECPAVIIFIDGDDEETEFAMSALQPVAEMQNASPGDDHKLMFLVGCDSDASDRLHEFFSLDDAVPLATLVDLPSNRVATLMDEVTSHSVEAMVRSFRDGTLEMRPVIADTFTT